MHFILRARLKLISVSFVSHLMLVFTFPFLQGTVCPQPPSPGVCFLSSCLQILLSLKTPWFSRGDLFCSCLFLQLACLPVGTGKPRVALAGRGGRPSSELASGAIWRGQSIPWYQHIIYQRPLTCLHSLLTFWRSMLNLCGIHQGYIKLKGIFSDI